MSPGQPPPPRQRADKWLWFARVAKTRALAARLVAGGHVRLNGRRMDDPGRGLLIGDVLTIALERDTRVMKVAAFGERRGPAPQARLLYDDMSAAATTEGDGAWRTPGLAARGGSE